MEHHRVRKSALILVLVIATALGIVAWSQYSARVEAESSLGLDASRVVAAQFSKVAALKVGTLRGTAIARGEDKGFAGVVPSEQTTRVPFTVDYFVDLSRLGQGSYRWDEKANTLTIDIPDVAPARPNIDETAAQSRQKGLYISRRASMELARQTSQRAAARSRQEAARLKHMQQARANARAAVAKMAQGSLAAVGMDHVQVAVSFPWEPKRPSDVSAEQWDRSRRIEDVLNEREAQAR